MAEDNRDVWGPRVDGNILINGTDPVFHAGQGGGVLTANGVVFAADAPDKTGLYVSLSCAYDRAVNLTVPLLDPFGTSRSAAPAATAMPISWRPIRRSKISKTATSPTGAARYTRSSTSGRRIAS
ncbi:MAG: hypothetical protein H0V12_08515 [Chloroflexi bacterium]|nr:hypothetical protein [Chloroflexota bacterium]